MPFGRHAISVFAWAASSTTEYNSNRRAIKPASLFLATQLRTQAGMFSPQMAAPGETRHTNRLALMIIFARKVFNRNLLQTHTHTIFDTLEMDTEGHRHAMLTQRADTKAQHANMHDPSFLPPPTACHSV